MLIAKKDVQDAAGALKVCAGQDTVAEAAVHATYDLFKDDEIETVLLIIAKIEFNFINKEVMLQNISIMCPIISTSISNCYCIPAWLFIIGNKEVISREGTKQEDLTGIGAYALAVTPLLHFL